MESMDPFQAFLMPAGERNKAHYERGHTNIYKTLYLLIIIYYYDYYLYNCLYLIYINIIEVYSYNILLKFNYIQGDDSSVIK